MSLIKQRFNAKDEPVIPVVLQTVQLKSWGCLGLIRPPTLPSQPARSKRNSTPALSLPSSFQSDRQVAVRLAWKSSYTRENTVREAFYQPATFKGVYSSLEHRTHTSATSVAAAAAAAWSKLRMYARYAIFCLSRWRRRRALGGADFWCPRHEDTEGLLKSAHGGNDLPY